MSDTTTLALDIEIAKLQQELFQKDQGLEGLLAQLDAHKALINESLSASLLLKANQILGQKQNQKLVDTISSLQKQLEDATTKITELESAKPKEE